MSEQLVGIGLDLLELDRFARALARPGFAARVFTETELGACNGAVASLGARFCAREAAMKALGVGLWAFDLRDVSVVGGRGGVPALVVVGRAEQCARTRGVSEWRLSLTHTRGCAGAVVVALG